MNCGKRTLIAKTLGFNMNSKQRIEEIKKAAGTDYQVTKEHEGSVLLLFKVRQSDNRTTAAPIKLSDCDTPDGISKAVDKCKEDIRQYRVNNNFAI